MEQNKKEVENKLISRREFMKNSALVAAGFSIVPRHVLGGKGYVAPSDKLYIACVGSGGRAADDIRGLASHPKSEIAFLCDVDDKRSASIRKQFPEVPYYHDWRKMLDKEHKNFDAVCVAIPDHNHAIVGLNAMKLNKHLYLEKPLTHDIYETRMLTKAAKKYKVVTQMGDGGSSNDGVRLLKEWFDVGLIGDIKKVYNWTNRPVWPQGIPWPSKHPKVPKTLKWNLWLGTAPQTKYIANLVPFNWRGWWSFGTGALGDMGCHLMGASFKLLGIKYPIEVTCDASTTFSDEFEPTDYDLSIPISSKIRFIFETRNGDRLKFYWLDGGMIPERPEGLPPNANMNHILAGPSNGGTMFVGTKGIVSCGIGGANVKLYQSGSFIEGNELNIPQKYPRVNYPNGSGNRGHWWQWIDAAIAGYGNDYEGNAALPMPGQDKAYVDSPIVGYAGPLTETVLMGNLLLRSFGIRHKANGNKQVYGGVAGYVYPGRYISYKWDGANMKITNFKAANQFVKRTYRKGWGPIKI